MINTKQLILDALSARKKAYAPYSRFKVGAAILTDNEKIYQGFNVECAAYSVCNCAERTALFRAIYDGYTKFVAIAVVGGKESEDVPLNYCPPCGMCRQAFREFCNPIDFKVVLAKNMEEFKIYTLQDLLPESFGPENL